MIFYYLLTALILWSNLSIEGGNAVRYYARKLFAPSYYSSMEQLDRKHCDPKLEVLISLQKSALDRLYRSIDNQAQSMTSVEELLHRGKVRIPPERLEAYLSAMNFPKSSTSGIS